MELVFLIKTSKMENEHRLLFFWFGAKGIKMTYEKYNRFRCTFYSFTFPNLKNFANKFRVNPRNPI